MDLEKMNKILEKFWWGVAIVTLIAVLYFGFSQGFDKWNLYFVVPVLAVAMALMRGFMRKKLEKNNSFKSKKQ